MTGRKIGAMTQWFATASVSILLASPAVWADGIKASHGISVFGDLKYPTEFRQFDYVNADAPKGGEIKLQSVGTYETVNPFILKGRKEVLSGLIFDTLMERAMDEPDAVYGTGSNLTSIRARNFTMARGSPPPM